MSDPDRVLPGAAAQRPRHAFMPFGAEPRACIGATFALHEAVIVLSTFMRRLRFDSRSAAAPKLRKLITPRPGASIMMRVLPASLVA